MRPCVGNTQPSAMVISQNEVLLVRFQAGRRQRAWQLSQTDDSHTETVSIPSTSEGFNPQSSITIQISRLYLIHDWTVSINVCFSLSPRPLKSIHMSDFKFYSSYLGVREKTLDLSSDSYCPCNRLGRTLCICNTNARETEIRGFVGLNGQPA